MDNFHLNYQHKGDLKNYKNLEANIIHLVMGIKWLLGRKNGNGVKSNSNKNYVLGTTKAVTRK